MRSKIFKIISVMLSVVMILSVCFINGMVVSAEKITDYYVGYGGTGDGSSLSNKAPDVATAIATMNKSGNLTATDTANIWIVQNIDAVKNMGIVGTTSKHNLAYWSADGTVEEHECKIVVKPHKDNNISSVGKTYLFTGDLVGNQDILTLGGPTEMDGLEIVFPHSNGNHQYGVNVNGKSIVYGANMTFDYIALSGSTANEWTGLINGQYAFLPHSFGIAGRTYDAPVSLTFNSKPGVSNSKIQLPGYDAGSYRFNSDINLTFDGGVDKRYICVGTKGANSNIIIEKNVNIKINGGVIRFTNESAFSKMVLKGGLQLIFTSDTSVDGGHPITDLTDNILKADGTTKNEDIWKLIIDKANYSKINFIEGETGKFQLADNTFAIATPVGGGSAIPSIQGILDLSQAPGEYNVTITSKCLEYYVQGGATGSGMSESDPAGSVADAVASMNTNGGLSADDEATIWIMQDIAAPANMGASGKFGTHNLAIWGEVPAHTAKIIVKPHIDNQKENASAGLPTYLAITELIGNNVEMNFAGPTDIDNLKIVYCSTSNLGNTNNGRINFFGNNVRLGSKLSFCNVTTASDGLVNSQTGSTWDGSLHDKDFISTDIYDVVSTAKTVENEVNVEFATNVNGYTNGGYIGLPSVTGTTDVTFKKDVTIAITGTSSIGRLAIGWENSSAPVVFKQNLNFKLFSETSNWNFGNNGNAVVEGGVQVIRSKEFEGTGAQYSAIAGYPIYKTTALSDGAKADVWFLNVDDASKNLIDFVPDETGMFKVAGNVVAKATPVGGGTAVESENGVLKLSNAPGEYNVSFEVVKEKVYTYYVKAGGTGLGISKDEPAGSVEVAVNAVNALGLTANEEATIYIMQDITATGTGNSHETNGHNMAYWASSGSGMPEHEAKIFIKPYANNSTSLPTYLVFGPQFGVTQKLILGGRTIFQDVTLTFTCSTNAGNNSSSLIVPNGHHIQISSGVKYAYLNVAEGSSSWDGTAKSSNFLTTALASDQSKEFTDPISIELNSANIVSNSFCIPAVENVTQTFKEKVSLKFNAVGTSLYGNYIQIGSNNANSTVTFEKGLNILVRHEKATMRFKSGSGKVVVKGGVQFINNASANYILNGNDYSFATVKNKFVDENNNPANIWFLNVENSDIDTVTFTDTIGKFKATKTGLTAIAVKDDKSVVIEANASGILDLTQHPGTYTILYKETMTEGSTYANFIDYNGYIDSLDTHKYSGALANTYHKLHTEKQLNVVYLGGSVTAGAGSESEGNAGCWRVRVGEWLDQQFPAATINHYDQAIGETGTRLASYRLQRDIISKAPDLLFLEYSINDYYDRFYINAGRASIQYETVVRKIKEAYPECDIVTVLVTDMENVKRAGNGGDVLHDYSRAHKAMAEIYDSSVINVGQVLSNEIYRVGGGTFSSTVWYDYVKDSVHPKNKGYNVYFQVIKEFLTNTLLFSDYNTNITKQKLPALQSDYLFDGDIDFIDDTDSRVSFTTADGAKQTTNQGILHPDYKGLIFVPYGSSDTITVKFTGTELVMLTKAGDFMMVNGEENTYQIVSVDGVADGTKYQYQDKNPNTIVNGLDYGEHTVVIRPSSLSQKGVTYNNQTEIRIDGFYSRNIYKMSNKLNICDLVALADMAEDSADRCNNVFDYDNSGGRLDIRVYPNYKIVDDKDFAVLKKILINNKK